MENTQYKGFAYTKGNKPTILFGETRDDILKKLNAYNTARTQEYKFQTCSIGSLDAETDKYTDYHRYEVATGKDITSIYLEIPPLKKEEFQKVTADLKEAGARFNPNKKQWYITSDQELQKFQDICNQFSGPETATYWQDLHDEVEKSMEEQTAGRKYDFQIDGLEIQYAVRLQNQQTVIIPESEIRMLNIKGSADEFLNKLNDRAVERAMPQTQITEEQILKDPEQLARESEYTISASKEADDNRCTIWYNDGREPVELRGDAYGLNFPGMSSEEVADFVSGYLKNMEQPERIRTEYMEGDNIDCYVPLRLNVDPNQPVYVENVSHVVGNVRGVGSLANTDAKIYEIVQEGGSVRTIRSDEIYAPDQARVLLRAAADELTSVQFDLLADRNLSAAQMEEIRFGFKDGLTAEQVALYANPEMTPAEMDMCRIGLNNGLGYAEISRIRKETKELSWTDSRNRLNEAVRDHRDMESVEDYKLMLKRMEESEKTEAAQEEKQPEAEAPEQNQENVNTLPGDSEPTVTILWSEHSRFHDGEIMSLSEANALMERLDAETIESNEYYKTKFRIDFVMNGELKHYEGRQDFGDGEGSLIDHIEQFYAYYENNEQWDARVMQSGGQEALDADRETREFVLHEFIPYLKMHCNLSEMERIAGEAQQFGQSLTPVEIAYHSAIQDYVVKCRGLINQGEYNLPPIPQQHKDFDTELESYQEHVREEIVQEAATAGMTVEEYAANGYEPINQPENVASETADFYGIHVPMENGKRVVSQEVINQFMYDAATKGLTEELTEKAFSGSYRNCIFRGVNFQDYHTDLFKNADFSGSEFHQCKLYKDMRGSSFQDTIFANTSFKAVLNDCDFSRSQITKCRFEASDMGVNFSKAAIRETGFYDCEMIGTNFSEATIKQTDFHACDMEFNNFYKTQMDAVTVSESCSVSDSKHFDTISAENMTERTLWQLSGVSEVTYERKEELQKFFRQEQEDNLDPENADWRLELSRDERELVDVWEKQQTQVSDPVEEIMKSGYKPTEKLISNIRKLDALTGKANTMKEIYHAYKDGCAGMNQEQKDAIVQIAQECKQQELARIAIPTSVPG